MSFRAWQLQSKSRNQNVKKPKAIIMLLPLMHFRTFLQWRWVLQQTHNQVWLGLRQLSDRLKILGHSSKTSPYMSQ